MVNFLLHGRSSKPALKAVYCNVFRKSELDFLQKKCVLHTKRCDTHCKKDTQRISVQFNKMQFFSAPPAHICRLTALDTRNYGQFTQLSLFVAFKPHFTWCLVTQNLKTILVTDLILTWRRLESETRSKKTFLAGTVQLFIFRSQREG